MLPFRLEMKRGHPVRAGDKVSEPIHELLFIRSSRARGG